MYVIIQVYQVCSSDLHDVCILDKLSMFSPLSATVTLPHRSPRCMQRSVPSHSKRMWCPWACAGHVVWSQRGAMRSREGEDKPGVVGIWGGNRGITWLPEYPYACVPAYPVSILYLDTQYLCTYVLVHLGVHPLKYLCTCEITLQICNVILNILITICYTEESSVFPTLLMPQILFQNNQPSTTSTTNYSLQTNSY